MANASLMPSDERMQQKSLHRKPTLFVQIEYRYLEGTHSTDSVYPCERRRPAKDVAIDMAKLISLNLGQRENRGCQNSTKRFTCMSR